MKPELQERHDSRAANELFGLAHIASMRTDSVLALDVCRKLVSLQGKYELVHCELIRPAPEPPSKASAHPLESQYAGACKKCGGRYDVGAKIYWKRGAGANHAECGPL